MTTLTETWKAHQTGEACLASPPFVSHEKAIWKEKETYLGDFLTMIINHLQVVEVVFAPYFFLKDMFNVTNCVLDSWIVPFVCKWHHFWKLLTQGLKWTEFDIHPELISLPFRTCSSLMIFSMGQFLP